MKRQSFYLIIILIFICNLILTGCNQPSSNTSNQNLLDPNNPTTITLWHSYNGSQLQAFEDVINNFNTTKGKELGIIVSSSNQGSIEDLLDTVLSGAASDNAQNIPNICSAYSDTAYTMDNMNLLVDLNNYLTSDDLDKYIPEYLDAGRINNDNSIKIFPVAKSTEILMLCTNYWEPFAQATNTHISELDTIEGLLSVAEKYYNWTDSLTPAPNDGKAFFGRDALANYMIVGSKQLGVDIFTVDDTGKGQLNFDHDVIRKLWDNYYVPYIKGHFLSAGRFRTDDVKTGSIISFVGSTASAVFFPTEIALDNQPVESIQCQVFPCPHFNEGGAYVVQQGAGMVVTKSAPAKEYASIEFLKWFTQSERNTQFSLEAGYLPVTKEATDINYVNNIISNQHKSINSSLASAIPVAINMAKNNKMYTAPVFHNATNVRTALQNAIDKKCADDRQAVLDYIAQGIEYNQAVALVNTDENFEDWYNSTKIQLEKLME